MFCIQYPVSHLVVVNKRVFLSDFFKNTWGFLSIPKRYQIGKMRKNCLGIVNFHSFNLWLPGCTFSCSWHQKVEITHKINVESFLFDSWLNKWPLRGIFCKKNFDWIQVHLFMEVFLTSILAKKWHLKFQKNEK